MKGNIDIEYLLYTVCHSCFTDRGQGKADGRGKDWGGINQEAKGKKTRGRILTRHKHGAAVRVQGDALSLTQHTLAYFFQEYGVGYP